VSACPRCGLADPSRRLAVCPRCLLQGDEMAGPAPDLGLHWLAIEGELGAGGMGRVFRARDVRLGRAVAVKVLRQESAADPAFRERFSREARTLAQLDHPGIVTLHDFGTSPQGESYLVMQLVAGGSLAERGPLPPAEAVGFARQLCDALAYAHKRGIVHRDIKPENVLVGEDGRAKLSDFGIARLLDPPSEERPLTRPSVVLGTPGYLAPEARAGAPVDPRMDVYALGSLIFYMLTGRDPDGSTASSGALAAAIPAEAAALAPVVARAMAVDPARRTASAEALGLDLAAVAARLAPAVAGAESLPAEERTWRGAVALLGAVATATVLYAGLVSLTPRAMAPEEALPFTAFGSERLADGRVLTRARFETWPTLGAAVAIALALFAHGLLRRHWRLNGFDRPAPARPLPNARRVLAIGLGLFALFLVGRFLESGGATDLASYVPVLGGALELVLLFRFWDVVLEAQRTARSLAHEPLVWTGLVLGLFPPAYHVALLARIATRH